MDTIAAVATPRGEGALGIVRISGPLSSAVLDGVVPGTKATSQPGRMLHGLARDPASGAVIDEVMCFFAQGPRTATGEDVAEVHGHGGTIVLASILGAAIASGARPAQPGEFTYRAFRNGRIDLAQAEAVMTLIGAGSDRAARAAIQQLAGGLGARLGSEYEALTTIAANLEAGLDFPEEDLPVDETSRLADALQPVVDKLTRARDSFLLGDRLTRGAVVAICGPANAGKSSVLNRLIGEERAIVDEEPGTTRDVVEASWEIAGIPVRLLDTAGLRETETGVERRGIAKSFEALESADLVLLVLDGTSGSADRDEVDSLIDASGDTDMLLVLNKADLPTWEDRASGKTSLLRRIALSALDGTGRADLTEAMSDLLGARQDHQEVLLTTARQHAAVAGAVKHAARAMARLRRRSEPELAATDLRWARESLASLWGRNATDEMLDALFASFCLGK